MTKILFVTEFFPTGKDLRFSGGVEARTLFVAGELAKRNRVYVLTSHLKGAKKHEMLNKIEVFRVGPIRDYKASYGDFTSRIGFTIAAIKFAKTLNPDIVDGSNFLTHFITALVAKNLKIPSVAWYPDVWQGSWLKLVGISGLLGEILERINFMLGFNAYIAISQATAKKLAKFTKKRIIVIPCGVDIKEFSYKSKKSKSPTIICISRLVAYKRIKDLIFAFALIKKSDIKANLLIVGQGPQEKELKQITKMLKITKHVHFEGNLKRHELINNIHSAILFCLPSEIEGFGIAVIEASAAGVPYVVSGIDVFREITQNGQGGLFFKLGDVRDLSAKIKKLLTDKNLYAKKSKEARILTQNYQWPQIAQQTEILYKSLL